MNEIESLYKSHGAMVLRRCRHLLRSEADALDVMQDVFIAVMQKRHVLDTRSPSSLLYCMATNACLNRIRDSKVQARLFDSGKEYDVLALIASHEDIEAATAAERLLTMIWGRQPDSSRVMAVLHYLDGMTLEEVATAMQMSVSGVRKRLRKLTEVAQLMSGKSNEN